jgi:hypothetical protein
MPAFVPLSVLKVSLGVISDFLPESHHQGGFGLHLWSCNIFRDITKAMPRSRVSIAHHDRKQNMRWRAPILACSMVACGMFVHKFGSGVP